MLSALRDKAAAEPFTAQATHCEKCGGAHESGSDSADGLRLIGVVGGLWTSRSDSTLHPHITYLPGDAHAASGNKGGGVVPLKYASTTACK